MFIVLQVTVGMEKMKGEKMIRFFYGEIIIANVVQYQENIIHVLFMIFVFWNNVVRPWWLSKILS